MLPMIAVPTTAGKGERRAPSFALIANAKTHMKMACGTRKPRVGLRSSIRN
ncbi:MAG: hypothetical protein Ct9H300mP1_15950 [Planctomycetaceae bacterium]|nr:MAG: hypothetical protein Ct9H300mP1_15950 [Planctomycetaceae bacterium]